MNGERMRVDMPLLPPWRLLTSSWDASLADAGFPWAEVECAGSGVDDALRWGKKPWKWGLVCGLDKIKGACGWEKDFIQRCSSIEEKPCVQHWGVCVCVFKFTMTVSGESFFSLFYDFVSQKNSEIQRRYKQTFDLSLFPLPYPSPPPPPSFFFFLLMTADFTEKTSKTLLKTEQCQSPKGACTVYSLEVLSVTNGCAYCIFSRGIV